MKAILAMLILLSATGCTVDNDERETQTIDICTECDPLTEDPLDEERDKNHVEGDKNHPEGGVIEALFPASDAEGVQLDTKISIVFNRDIDPSELTSAQFYMTNSRGEEIETELVYEDRKVTLTPTNKLNLLTTYTLSLEGAKTLAGRQIDKKTWRFTTRDGAWGAPRVLQLETRKESFGGKIVADQHGNAVAIWAQYENFRAQLWEARYKTGRGWLLSNPLEVHGADYSAVGFKLAMDSGGHAAASWILHWGAGRMAFNFLGSSGVWGEAEIINDWGIIEQDIAMGENDQTLISSITEGDDAELFLVMFDRNREIFSFQAMPCDSECYYTEGIFDDQGKAYFVVERSRDGQYSEILVGAFDGEHWGVSVIKEAGSGDSSDPRLVISKGTPAVFWSQWGEDAGVWMRIFQDGRWLPEERMSANETTTNLKVESNLSGDVVATWTEGEYNPHLYANIYMAGSGKWTGPRRIDVGEGELYAPGAVIDGEGNVTVAWSQSKDYDHVDSLYTARYDSVLGKWSEGKRVRAIHLALKTAPSLTVLNDGRVFLLTAQFENNWNSVVLEFK